MLGEKILFLFKLSNDKDLLSENYDSKHFLQSHKYECNLI